MLKWSHFRWPVLLALLLPVLIGCGDGGGRSVPVIVGPGLVGIDDQPAVAITAPELRIEYLVPGVPQTLVAFILSDQPSDGDIAFDPVAGSFTITQGPDTLLFGIDSALPNEPEYRAFLDFPLDGSTGQTVIPADATILAADLTIFVNFVDFAATVPVLLDLIEYSVPFGLAPGDFSSAPLSTISFDIFSFDAGTDVFIDVTLLLAVAQSLALNDFQVRFLLGH